MQGHPQQPILVLQVPPSNGAQVAIVRTLDNLSSSGMECAEEENHVMNALKGNDYPSGFSRKLTIARRRRQNERLQWIMSFGASVELGYSLCFTVLPNDLQSNALGIVSPTHSCNSRRAIGVPPPPSLEELDNSLPEVGIRLSNFLTDY